MMTVAPRSASFNLAKLGRQMRLGAVAGGAYLSGELRGDADVSIAWDYRRKRREVVARGVHAPVGWNGERLWSECEKREAREDAIFGRRIIADLPLQITHEARIAIAGRFAEMLRELHGVGVEWAIHRPPSQGDGRNWHVHIQFTSRPVNGAGKWAKKRSGNGTPGRRNGKP